MSKYDKAYFDKLERRREDPDYDPPPPPQEKPAPKRTRGQTLALWILWLAFALLILGFWIVPGYGDTINR